MTLRRVWTASGAVAHDSIATEKGDNVKLWERWAPLTGVLSVVCEIRVPIFGVCPMQGWESVDDETGRLARSLRQMKLRIDDQIVVGGRLFVVRGFDPFGVPAGRVYLEDEATGELVTESMACLQDAEPAIRRSEEDSRGDGHPKRKQDE